MQIRRHGTDPVFVDRTGRRRRIFLLAGAAGGVVLVLATVALLAGFTGVGSRYLPALPGLPGSGAGQAQGVAPTPKPSGTAIPTRQIPRSTAPTTSPRPAGAPQPAVVPPPGTTAGAGMTATPTGPSSRRNEPTQTPTTHPSKRS
jgi:hypothetical protein